MRKHLGAAVAVFAASLLCTPSAGAATEVGGDCVANTSAKDLTVVGFSRAGNPFPLSVPAAGVVTRWKVQVEPGKETLPQRLVVMRAIGKASDLIAVDESETELVDAGANEFATRIPVRSGDRFGLSGFTETYFCEQGTDISWLYEGEAPIGEPRPFKLKEGIGAPVSAIVEPDRDGDGYGDETQDECPQSVEFHLQACSPVTLAVDAKARKRSILVHVRADMEVSVQVFGQVGWGFKSKRKSSGGHSKPTRLIVGLRGSTKDVAPGKAVSFRIALPKAVMRRLGRITPQESLKAQITALATDPEGALAVRRLTVRLKGWKR
jgi:hypothetical protein